MIKLLLIGCNYRGMPEELSGCLNDIDNMYNFYKTNYGVIDSNIMMLRDDVITKMPTKQNILSAFAWLVNGAKQGDLLLMHYSGHGSYVVDRNRDELSGYDSTIVPYDFKRRGMIIDDDIYSLLVKKVPTGAKLFGVLDSCFSGTGFDLKYSMTVNGNSDGITSGTRRVDTFTNEVVLLSGCKDSQTSADTYEVTNGKMQAQGALTWALLDVWGRDKNISCHNLIRGIRQLLSENEYTQIPQLSFNYAPTFTETLLSITTPKPVKPTKPAKPVKKSKPSKQSKQINITKKSTLNNTNTKLVMGIDTTQKLGPDMPTISNDRVKNIKKSLRTTPNNTNKTRQPLVRHSANMNIMMSNNINVQTRSVAMNKTGRKV